MTLYTRAASVIDAALGDEIVAIHIKSGECFELNEVAACVWRSLDSPKGFDELRDELLGAYEVSMEQCTCELEELLQDLVSKGLLQRVD